MKIQIKYSKEDECYVAQLENWKSTDHRWRFVGAHGDTEEEALIEFTEAIKGFEEIYRNKPWREKLTHYTDPAPHFAWREIELHAPPEELEKLDKWMRGQTMTLRDDGDVGIYIWDFERWLNQGKKMKQGVTTPSNKFGSPFA